MFLITTGFQQSRSRLHPDKPGRVVFRIARKDDGDPAWTSRKVTSDICGDRDSAVNDNRDKVIACLRIISCIIEMRHDSACPFTLDDIVSDFRKAAAGDRSMVGVIARASEDPPLRADIISVGNGFRRDFKFVYPDKPGAPGGLLCYMSDLSREARAAGKISISRSYSSTRGSISRFLDGADIDLGDIDRPFVSAYSSWLSETGVSDSTRSFYLRTLRAIINHAATDGLLRTGESLFKGFDTRVIFGERTEIRDPLDRETLKKIAGLDFHRDPEAETVRDMFMFGFYCRGMELIDITNLTRSNIRGDMLVYKRRLKGLPKTVCLDKKAMDIVRRYQSPDNDYVFPFLDRYKGLQQYSVNNIVSRHIKQIGRAVGFPALTFSMNITAWQTLMNRSDLPDLLLGNL